MSELLGAKEPLDSELSLFIELQAAAQLRTPAIESKAVET